MKSEANKKPQAESLPWWHGAIIYQIYPRSFLDTNGDGIGDLNGITEGLEYVASLGVDAVWISPFFTSPMKDFGYDVSDYCDIDPIFGTLADFDRMIERAHALGLRIIIDQVYSHTSDAHDWFQEGRSDHTNAKADWYIWQDAKPDGGPPSNWQSVFGGPAWQWDGRRKQYYMHNFLTSQPDLNVHNPQVQDALLSVTKFWLDRGVDGFRLDAINFAMQDTRFRDNPPSGLPMEKVTRPFDMQAHTYNQSHPDIVLFLERIRMLLDQYDNRFTVAEVVGANPFAEMQAFTANNKRLNSAYNFEFLYLSELSVRAVTRSLSPWDGAPGQSWPSWAFSNHDAPRAVSRWSKGASTPQHAELYLLLLLSLRGNAFIYQGEELALPQGVIPFEALQDPEAIENWPHTLGRDGARTPIPWKAQSEFGGFSSGTPWLPLSDDQIARAIDQQDGFDGSPLQYAKRAISFRQNNPTLKLGSLEFIPAADGVLAFQRKHEGQTLICVFNLSENAVDWRPETMPDLRVLIGASIPEGPVPLTLPPLAGYIAQS